MEGSGATPGLGRLEQQGAVSDQKAEPVLLSTGDGVATITLHRPEVFNALDRTLGEGLAGALEAAVEDSAVRAIVLTGAGGGFCAGGDVRAALRYIEDGGDPRQYFGDVILLLNRIVLGLWRAPKPVIAAINGAVGGAGLSLAAACDLRLAAESAKFKQAYTSIGLVPDGGWTLTVPRLIGAAKAAELLYLDPLVCSADAQRFGLVHEVVADDALLARAHEMASRLAQGPVSAFAAAKELMNQPLLAELERQLERERQAIMAQARTGDFRERVQRFVSGARRGERA